MAAVSMCALLVALTIAPASAAQYSRERYSWSDSGSYECGEGNWIDWHAEGQGSFSIRAGTGKDAGAFFAHDNYEWHAVDTRRSDGTALHFSGNGNFIETRAVRIEGSIFQFWAVEAGQPFVVRDGDGNVLVRDRGSVHQSIIFDTLGDGTPGGEFIEEVFVHLNGPHPGWEFDSCEYFG
jgi:hypothetical protein